MNRFIIALMLFQFTIIKSVYADVDNSNGAHSFNTDFFASSGLYSGGDAFGIGFTFGVSIEHDSSMYTLRNTIFIDFLDSIASCTTEPVTVCNDEGNSATINEFAFLYGKKLKSIWLSGGIGYVNGENLNGLFSDGKQSFSTTGLAYSVLWLKPIKWFDVNYELSGNVNAENSYFFISGRYIF